VHNNFHKATQVLLLIKMLHSMASSKEDFKKDLYWKYAYLATARQLDNFRSKLTPQQSHLPQVGNSPRRA